MIDHVAIIIKNKDKVLFIKRSKFKKILPNLWSLPSGTQEKTENIFQTAEREALEELGIKIKAKSLLSTKELPEFNVKLHFVICSMVAGIPEIRDEYEISELNWSTFEEFFNQYSDDEIGHGLIYLRTFISLQSQPFLSLL